MPLNSPLDKSNQKQPTRLNPKKNPSNTLQKQGRGKIPSDTQGSYTGTPEDGLIPEQDPDDL